MFNIQKKSYIVINKENFHATWRRTLQQFGGAIAGDYVTYRNINQRYSASWINRSILCGCSPCRMRHDNREWFGTMHRRPTCFHCLCLKDTEQEKEHIRRALEQANGNRSIAAPLLGIGRSTLYRKMLEYGITSSEAFTWKKPESWICFRFLLLLLHQDEWRW